MNFDSCASVDFVWSLVPLWSLVLVSGPLSLTLAPGLVPWSLVLGPVVPCPWSLVHCPGPDPWFGRPACRLGGPRTRGWGGGVLVCPGLRRQDATPFASLVRGLETCLGPTRGSVLGLWSLAHWSLVLGPSSWLGPMRFQDVVTASYSNMA